MANLVITIGNGLSATINRFPEGDVLPGEPVNFWVSGLTGFNGADEWEEADFLWEFDDAGSTYSVGGSGYSTNAEFEFGRMVSKAWEGTGDKIVKLLIRVHGQDVPAEVTVTVPVVDSDTIAWTKDLYVDLGEVSGTPDFTGAPDDTPSEIIHISDLATLLANDPSSASDKTRITFKLGETFTWGDTGFYIPGHVYVRTLTGFGSGDRPKILAGDVEPTTVDDEVPVFTWFNGLSAMTDSRFCAYGIDLDGGYDPTTGLCPNGLYSLVGGRARFEGTSNQYAGTHKCDVSGAGLFAFGVGAWAPDALVHVSATDCSIRDWHNFGTSIIGPPTSYAFTGCTMKQNPLALVSTEARGIFPGTPDHGPGRVSSAIRGAIANSGLASNSGWSSLGTYEVAVQACWRHNFGYFSADYQEQAEFHWTRNRSFGSGCISLVHDNPDYLPPLRACIQMSEHNHGRQSLGGFVDARGGGIYLKNCVQYYANVSHELTGQDGFVTLGSYTEGSTVVDPAYYSNPIRVRNNTLVSDRSNDSGSNFSMDPIRNRAFVEGLGLGFDIVEENNIIELPNYTNADPFTDYTPLDRANNFRPVVDGVTDSAAFNAITTGTIPVRDFSGNLRGNPTNAGAHDVESSSAGTVNDPVNSAPPQIAELANFADEYALTSAGTWTNLTDDDLYLMEWEWNVDASPITDPKRVVYDAAGVTGDVSNDLTVTNRSGNRVTQGSNTITRA